MKSQEEEGDHIQHKERGWLTPHVERRQSDKRKQEGAGGGGERGGGGLWLGQVCLLSPQAYVTYQQCKFSKVQGWIDLCFADESQTQLTQ